MNVPNKVTIDFIPLKTLLNEIYERVLDKVWTTLENASVWLLNIIFGVKAEGS